MQKPWHSYSIQKVFHELKTSKNGLSAIEAEKRIKLYGENKLPEEKPVSGFMIFLSQFKSPLIYILIIAAAASFLLREYIDAGVIAAVVAINTLIGFFQENKANKAITLLRKMVEYRVLVLRDGKEIEINSADLVMGDLIFLREGERVPADARIIESRNLQIEESGLTGESMPSDKANVVLAVGKVIADRENMAFMGTTVVRGKGLAIICETGANTQIGKITKMIEETHEGDTPLQTKLKRLGRNLSLALIAIIAIIFIAGIWEIKLGIEKISYFKMFETAVAVAVGVIPEGLAVAVTAILAIGMQRILKKKSLVRKLLAAEILGSTSVICTDKTGTLTEGRMQVSHIASHEELIESRGHEFDSQALEENHIEVLKIGMRCNDAIIENSKDELEKNKIIGDPTETALISAAMQLGLEKGRDRIKHPRIDEITFDTDRKYMATLNKYDNRKNIIYVKGAPEIILNFSSRLKIGKGKKDLTKSDKERIKSQINDFTGKGLRVLAVAYKHADLKTVRIDESDMSDLVLVGILGLKDPLRKEAKETISLCKQAGIRTIIVTGDHKLTAKAIAKEVGLDAKEENIMEGHELEKISDERLRSIVRKIDIYARVSPKHKLKIINAWKSLGEVVAMTGDGVNDAPALKAADIGIAFGSGTDVAKEASDIILLDNNFKTIVEAVKQGRAIFENIRKVVLFLLKDSFIHIILIGGSLLFKLPLALLPVQILWVNLIEHSLLNFPLAFEPEEDDAMKEKPIKRNEPIMDREAKILTFLASTSVDAVLLTLFVYLFSVGYVLDRLRSIIMLGVGIDSIFLIFSFKTLRKNIWNQNLFTNKILNACVVLAALFLFGAVYIPFLQNILHTQALGIYEIAIVIIFGILELFAVELTKWVFIRRKARAVILS